MTTVTASASVTVATREVMLSRTINAPRDLVWAAWTDSKQMAQWWGPHHFTNRSARSTRGSAANFSSI
jgi:uncharacterized protein YndB with AHSA1/START domain